MFLTQSYGFTSKKHQTRSLYSFLTEIRSMNFPLLKELLQQFEVYHAHQDSGDIRSFTVWLNGRLFAAQPHDDSAHSGNDGLLIAFKMMYLSKSLKKQAKLILADSGVSSIDEYSMLLHLHHQESFRKMELVEMHNLEAPTGIEIIKRLVKNKYVEEFPDEADRRARRIRITKLGSNELNTLQPRLDEVFTDFTKPLELNEKVQLSGFLDKMM